MDQPHGTICTSTTVTKPVGERLQASTEDAPVLDCPAPLRRLRDSGAGYKYPDLLTDACLPVVVVPSADHQAGH